MVIRVRLYDKDNGCYVLPEAKYRKVTGFFTLEDDLNLNDFRMILV